jgi:hypothetical protein
MLPLRPAARQLARIVPVPKSVRPRLLDLSECPHCDSRLVQAADWKVHQDGRVWMSLRCPECLTWMSGTFTAERVRELDRRLSEGRAALRATYERTVRRHMTVEVESLARALELDLIGPDDFAPVAQRRKRSYQP